MNFLSNPLLLTTQVNLPFYRRVDHSYLEADYHYSIVAAMTLIHPLLLPKVLYIYGSVPSSRRVC